MRTQPLKVGAPLDPEDYLSIDTPDPAYVADELLRAQVELLHAVVRHRKAWASARHHKQEAESRAVWAEGYNPYKLAIADVRWWREEMSAQAAAVTALTGMLRPT